MIPSRQASSIPGRAAGKTTRVVVSQRVAPMAVEASRRSLGTAARLSSAMEATIGTIMIPIRKEALNRFSPVVRSRLSCSHGASTVIPMKPRTTDGRKPRISRAGLKNSRKSLGQASERKTATPRLRGMAISADRTVTETEPATRGSMPNSGGS